MKDREVQNPSKIKVQTAPIRVGLVKDTDAIRSTRERTQYLTARGNSPNINQEYTSRIGISSGESKRPQTSYHVKISTACQLTLSNERLRSALQFSVPYLSSLLECNVLRCASVTRRFFSRSLSLIYVVDILRNKNEMNNQI